MYFLPNQNSGLMSLFRVWQAPRQHSNLLTPLLLLKPRSKASSGSLEACSAMCTLTFILIILRRSCIVSKCHQKRHTYLPVALSEANYKGCELIGSPRLRQVIKVSFSSVKWMLNKSTYGFMFWNKGLHVTEFRSNRSTRLTASRVSHNPI